MLYTLAPGLLKGGGAWIRTRVSRVYSARAFSDYCDSVASSPTKLLPMVTKAGLEPATFRPITAQRSSLLSYLAVISMGFESISSCLRGRRYTS